MSTNFVLPTIGSADMSKDDQGALLVNQATAVIVSAWLQHAQWAHDQLISAGCGVRTPNQPGGVDWPTDYRITQNELISLINDIQDALKSF